VELQNESGQLIERVRNLQAHKNERCHHQIKTEMHENLEPTFSGGPRSSAQGREPNSILIDDYSFEL
jgi:hypothetical protein